MTTRTKEIYFDGYDLNTVSIISGLIHGIATWKNNNGTFDTLIQYSKGFFHGVEINFVHEKEIIFNTNSYNISNEVKFYYE